MQNIENTLKTRIENDNAETFVVIVPNEAARLKRQRELIAYHPRRAVANLRVHTLQRFVKRLYAELRPKRQNISQGLQTLWLHQIVDARTSNSESYTYQTFRPVPDIPVPDSTLSLIVSTINQLRERNEASSHFAARRWAPDSNLGDLTRIYQAYEKKLGERWIDGNGEHLLLANGFKAQLMQKAFPKVNLVVFEGFVLLSPADIEILKHMAAQGLEMWFRTDYVEENPALFKHVGKLVEELSRAGIQTETDYQRDTALHEHVSLNLFHNKDNTPAKQGQIQQNPVGAEGYYPCKAGVIPFCADSTADATSEIKLLKPADRSEEVEQIAHQIQQHVSRGDCKLSDICVTYHNLSQYQQRIAEIFPAYGIPYTYLEGVSLAKSEVVKAIFSRLSSNDASPVSPYFSDGDTKITPLQSRGKYHASTPVDVPESCASENAVSFSLTDLLHPDEFQKYIDSLLKNGRVSHQILNPMLRKNRALVEDEIGAYHQFNISVRELCNALKETGNEKQSLRKYIEQLRFIVNHTTYQHMVESTRDSVTILQPAQLRSLDFDTVFLGDFVDGSFPANFRPDALLPEGLYRDESEQLRDNRFLFYKVLKSFRKRLYLVVPKREGESDLLPSPFLASLEAVATIDSCEIQNPARVSPAGFLSAYGNYLWEMDTPSDNSFPSPYKENTPAKQGQIPLADMQPLIKHVVLVEKSRETTHARLEYEGKLTAGHLSEASREQLESLRDKTHSVTRLETYARCPFQYFGAHVLQLGTKEDDEEEGVSNLERGGLVHKILFKFYDRRREQPAINQCDETGFEEAKQLLSTVMDELLTDTGSDNLFREVDKDRLRVTLNKWLEVERAYDVTTTPHDFEVSVGHSDGVTGSVLSRPEPICIGGVRLNAKIDRIDVGEGVFNVIDYKTGSTVPKMPAILEGHALQLPIYLEIAKKLLGAGYEPAAGLYHKLRLNECKIELGIGAEAYRGNTYMLPTKTQQMVPDETFGTVIHRVSGYVAQYVNRISKGKFPLITRVEAFVDSEEEGELPLTPRNRTAPCNYCTYKRMCRVGAVHEGTGTVE